MGKKRSKRGSANKLIPSPSKKARRARNLTGKLTQKRKLRRVYRSNGPKAALEYAIKHGLILKDVIKNAAVAQSGRAPDL